MLGSKSEAQTRWRRVEVLWLWVLLKKITEGQIVWWVPWSAEQRGTPGAPVSDRRSLNLGSATHSETV